MLTGGWRSNCVCRRAVLQSKLVQITMKIPKKGIQVGQIFPNAVKKQPKKGLLSKDWLYGSVSDGGRVKGTWGWKKLHIQNFLLQHQIQKPLLQKTALNYFTIGYATHGFITLRFLTFFLNTILLFKQTNKQTSVWGNLPLYSPVVYIHQKKRAHVTMFLQPCW